MNNILIRNGLRLMIGAALGMAAARATAETKYFLDVDGTILDDQSPRSTWRRMWHLKLIEEPRNSAQPNPRALGLPPIMPVSYRELKAMLSKLGRGPGQINGLEPRELEKDPLYPDRPTSIIPGFYYVSPEVTFVEYRPVQKGKGYLVTRQEEAIQRAALMNEDLAKKLGRAPRGNELYHWSGPAMDLVKFALSKPETVENLIFGTAGDHSASEWQSLLWIWRREGLIRYAYGKNERGEKSWPMIHSISDPEALLWGRRFDERKGNLIQTLAESMAAKTTNRHYELNPDERDAERGLKREGHTLIVAEDHPVMLAHTRAKLMALSGELRITNQVKFVLLNAQPAGDPVDPLFPYEWTVFFRRKQRPATADEIKLWTGQKDCDRRLRKTAE